MLFLIYAKEALIGEHNQKPLLAVLQKEALIGTVFWEISTLHALAFVCALFTSTSLNRDTDTWEQSTVCNHIFIVPYWNL